jgi:hypothetical protein
MEGILIENHIQHKLPSDLFRLCRVSRDYKNFCTRQKGFIWYNYFQNDIVPFLDTKSTTLRQLAQTSLQDVSDKDLNALYLQGLREIVLVAWSDSERYNSAYRNKDTALYNDTNRLRIARAVVHICGLKNRLSHDTSRKTSEILINSIRYVSVYMQFAFYADMPDLLETIVRTWPNFFFQTNMYMEYDTDLTFGLLSMANVELSFKNKVSIAMLVKIVELFMMKNDLNPKGRMSPAYSAATRPILLPHRKGDPPSAGDSILAASGIQMQPTIPKLSFMSRILSPLKMRKIKKR